MSAILHAGAFVLAILLSIALVQTSLAVPTWWMALMISGLMNVPVALLAWADAPRWLIPLPIVAILGVLAFMLSAVAVEQHRRLQHLRRERDNARRPLRRPESVEASAPAPTGWWDAPTAVAPAAEDVVVDDTVADRDTLDEGQRSSGCSSDDDKREFDELMRRNFTA
ncbi:hypothetical protein SIM91_04830 [Rhodococcus opacus]|uniref:hypothetical protein n=1 Tax=Rhodococcus opacus TaxID=37919 RepID=UPI0002A3CE0D|nr:hypothetical protein [Rhodococcus opacus]ELB88912.1 hypothetical protein Rwratislav_32150 [Rhodococcus wratislaviensis IFP 2016]MDX5962647.1 hypothetical protein [Rhodococcus opacus]CAG7636056.1 hypothetical protein E143388_07751 [Rhodococcus opacus]